MRPARLPAYQFNIMGTGDAYHTDQAQRFDTMLNPFYTDGGTQPSTRLATPRIPPRRLFQIPDGDNPTVGLTALQFPGPDGDPATQRTPALTMLNGDPGVP